MRELLAIVIGSPTKPAAWWRRSNRRRCGRTSSASRPRIPARPQRRQSPGRPLSETAHDNSMYRSEVTKIAGPLRESGVNPDPKQLAGAMAFHDDIERGLEVLADGTSEFAPDVEAVPGAPVEV